MNASELSEILRLHVLWWKGDPKGKRADLSGAILSGADLSGAILSRAYLSGAILSGAYLSGADLSGAILSGADLSGAILSGADLSGAILSRAYLSGAILSRAILSGADLSGAILSGADLSGADLSGANLSGANLSGANLSRAYLSGADLSGANLSGANLSGANLLDVTGSPLPGLYLLKLQTAETKLRAWKYLSDGVTPYKSAGYTVGKTYSVKEYSTDERILCDAGLNVATLDWCLADSVTRDGVEFLEVEFEARDIIAVPLGTDGKFRVRKLKVLRKISREQAQAILNKQLGPLLRERKPA